MKLCALNGATAAVAAGCVALTCVTPRPVLVWNSTASAPLGLYYRQLGTAGIGDWVLIRPPSKQAQLAASRNYFPQHIGLIKRVAAQERDRVCRTGQTVSVNGRHTATALIRDSLGRELPTWSGCVALKRGEIFVLNAPPASFDSRYFGPVSRDHIIERIAPLWTF